MNIKWLCNSKDEATTILAKMNNLLEIHGYVTVAEFVELVDEKELAPSDDYGWYDLETAAINDCVLTLPNVIKIRKGE